MRVIRTITTIVCYPYVWCREMLLLGAEAIRYWRWRRLQRRAQVANTKQAVGESIDT